MIMNIIATVLLLLLAWDATATSARLSAYHGVKPTTWAVHMAVYIIVLLAIGAGVWS
jgi:hypothetical protein